MGLVSVPAELSFWQASAPPADKAMLIVAMAAIRYLFMTVSLCWLQVSNNDTDSLNGVCRRGVPAGVESCRKVSQDGGTGHFATNRPRLRCGSRSKNVPQAMALSALMGLSS